MDRTPATVVPAKDADPVPAAGGHDDCLGLHNGAQETVDRDGRPVRPPNPSDH
ncbi:hypothetical protein [Kitasatospora sp. NPDC001175]|uniref:hypothetical protein n=1 Tax=Kitasatospora sp. NPDC001175 TaxID=3157103 RepID=UPI003CFD6481